MGGRRRESHAPSPPPPKLVRRSRFNVKTQPGAATFALPAYLIDLESADVWVYDGP